MPKIVDHVEFRNHLLEESFALFARRGYHAITIREIAADLEVSTGTLYHYFSSKEDIFAQMLERLAAADVVDAVSRIPGNAKTADRVETLMSFVRAKESYFQNLLFILLDSLRAGPQTEAIVKRTLDLYRRAIIENVAPENPALGVFLFSGVIGFIVQRLAFGETTSSAEHTSLARRLVECVSPEAPGGHTHHAASASPSIS